MPSINDVFSIAQGSVFGIATDVFTSINGIVVLMFIVLGFGILVDLFGGSSKNSDDESEYLAFKARRDKQARFALRYHQENQTFSSDDAPFSDPYLNPSQKVKRFVAPHWDSGADFGTRGRHL